MEKLVRRLPAEWEKHQATLLSFPHEGADWPGKFGAIKWAFIDFIHKITEHEPVILIVKSVKHRETVDKMLRKAHTNVAGIEYLIQTTNRSWMRDTGPIIVTRNDRQPEALQFRFNGWAKYSNFRLDSHIPASVARYLDIPLTRVLYKRKPVVLEGGAIDCNGSGTLITTRECLLDLSHQVRNSGFNEKDYETLFAEYLGIHNVIWLNKGIEGDDTHGHVDDICRFAARNTIVACVEKNKTDPNHRNLEENLQILKSAKLEDGSKPDIIEIPMPRRIEFAEMRLPASYANFLITNGSVLVPTFNDKNDPIVLGIFQEIFHDREVIGIHALDLIWGLGTLHCLSHEIPAEN
jgi:agmatine deiminase